MQAECRVLIRNFRADYGSYSEEIIGYIKGVCEHFYIRAINCGSLRAKFMEHEDWEEVTVGGQLCGVTSFPFESFLKDEGFRLVVQRTDITDEYPEEEPDGIFGREYVYRCIVTNDWENSEKDIIAYYNYIGRHRVEPCCTNTCRGVGHLFINGQKGRVSFSDVGRECPVSFDASSAPSWFYCFSGHQVAVFHVRSAQFLWY